MTADPVAIIDIGSNSVRLVVYSGATRTPSVIFNEKVLAGLGRGVSETGELREEDQQRALAALCRFRLLTRQMKARRVRVVATAAVRDAENGSAFLRRIEEIGFEPELLSGPDEGFMAGQGVLSGIPDADGVVGDLGGGSLELVDLGGGDVRDSVSLPLGVLRIAPLLEKGEASLTKKVSRALDNVDFRERARGRPFYLVGGSWRALARLDMQLRNHPLPILHQYRMPPERPGELVEIIAELGRSELKAMSALPLARVPTIPNAALLLKALIKELKPSDLVVSSYGIREGVLLDDLPDGLRRLDPLIEAAREVGSSLGRFAQHGELLDRWIAPIFDDPPHLARLRLAACLLADVAWQTHPDFRSERGVELALHGNWVGVDGPGRVMMAQALFCSFGGTGSFDQFGVSSLCEPEELVRACRWGLAMRLGQRLSGGVAAGLQRSRLCIHGSSLRLELDRDSAALYGEAVERRLKALAEAMKLKPERIL